HRGALRSALSSPPAWSSRRRLNVGPSSARSESREIPAPPTPSLSRRHRSYALVSFTYSLPSERCGSGEILTLMRLRRGIHLSARDDAPMTIRTRRDLRRIVALIGLVALNASCGSHPSTPSAPGTIPPAVTAREVVFPGGGVDLHGYLWEPPGRGPFPTVLYNHGSEKLPGSKPTLGAFFTTQGFAFFVPHRRGQGLSPGQYISDLVAQSPPAQQNQVVVDQLVAQVDDVAAAL